MVFKRYLGKKRRINQLKGKNMKHEEIKNMPNVKVQGWDVQDLADQSTNKESDEILKEVLSGTETEPNSEIPDVKAFEGEKRRKDGNLDD